MVARVQTVAFQGIEAIEVDAQVTITSGLPAFKMVGMVERFW
jgi:magnesium chelatase family protein